MMKAIGILIFAIINCGSALEIPLKPGIKPQILPPIQFPTATESRFKIPLNNQEVKDFLLENQLVGNNVIQADLTKYSLKIVEHVQNLIIQAGLDPLKLSDQTLHLFPVGSIKLTNGFVQDLSYINISDAVLARFQEDTDIFDLSIPLKFDTLMISYDYLTTVLLVKVKGSLGVKVSNVRLNLRLGFDFLEYHAFFDEIDVRDSGKITIQFTGLGLLNGIVEMFLDVITLFIHKLVLSIVNFVIKIPVNAVISEINSILDNIFA